jgi:hypothetical protein
VEHKLAMFSCGKDATTLGPKLWLLLQDYKNIKWVCNRRVQWPVVNVSTFHVDKPRRVFFMLEEVVVLVSTQQKLLHYDLNGNLKESFRCDGCHLRCKTIRTEKE